MELDQPIGLRSNFSPVRRRRDQGYPPPTRRQIGAVIVGRQAFFLQTEGRQQDGTFAVMALHGCRFGGRDKPYDLRSSPDPAGQKYKQRNGRNKDRADHDRRSFPVKASHARNPDTGLPASQIKPLNAGQPTKVIIDAKTTTPAKTPAAKLRRSPKNTATATPTHTKPT